MDDVAPTNGGMWLLIVVWLSSTFNLQLPRGGLVYLDQCKFPNPLPGNT